MCCMAETTTVTVFIHRWRESLGYLRNATARARQLYVLAVTELFKHDCGFQKGKDRSQKPDASQNKTGELTTLSRA